MFNQKGGAKARSLKGHLAVRQSTLPAADLLCLTGGQPTSQLGKRGAYRFKGVGVIRGRGTPDILEAWPLAKHAPPLHIGCTNQLLQTILGVEDLSDVAGQRDKRPIKGVE